MRSKTSHLLALLPALLLPAAAVAQGTPVNTRAFPVAASGISVTLQDFAVLPAYNGGAARPQFLTPAPDGTTDLFAVDANGLIYRISADGASITPFLDVNTQGLSFITGGEEGLIGLAFHPNFNGAPGTPGYGKFYTHISVKTGSGTPDFLTTQGNDHDQVIEEWTVTSPTAATFAGSHREVLRVRKFASNHNGGNIRFNPNAAPGSADYGNLYIGFGDGGGGNDPSNNGQNTESPLGKILRINPLVTATGAKYGLPSDNPFPTGKLAAPLVWAYGLRNPQQFSFEHGPNGRMFIDDIGQLQVEEVNIGVRGANYGWQLREGTYATGTGVGASNAKNQYGSYPLPAGDAAKGFAYPIAQLDHVDPDSSSVVNAAVGSGFVYQGSQVADLKGHFVFTDFAQSRLYEITSAYGTSRRARPVSSVEMVYQGASYGTLAGSPLAASGRPDLRLGDDGNGELYALVKGVGAILKITPTPPAGP